MNKKKPFIDKFIQSVYHFRQQKKFYTYTSVMRRGWHVQVLKYDLMKEYYQTIPLEEQVGVTPKKLSPTNCAY